MSTVAGLLRTRLSLFCVLIAAASSAACGGRTNLDPGEYEETPDDAGIGDAKPDIQYDVLIDSKTCTPSNCPTGCCDTTGACRPGEGAAACGNGGYMCVDCTAFGLQCSASTHTCTPAPTCNASTCPNGCCEPSTGQCVKGTDAAQCGSGGAQCVACLASQQCNATSSGGTCVGTTQCGPATCSGCCDAQGSCREGNAANACGGGGTACMDCSSLGGQCDPSAKVCYAAGCNPGNCPWGCCDGATGQCMKGLDPWQCGSGGALCQPCAPGQACQMSGSGGVCAGTSECNPATCSGCCDYNSWPVACVYGGDPGACGYKGQACQYCAGPGQYCEWIGDGGMCVQTAECNATTCPYGCCDPNTWPMQCVTGTDPWACGSNGSVCQYCASPNQQCIATWSGGMCTTSTQCGPGTCDGCCDPNSYPSQCLPGNDLKQCGAQGQYCMVCGPTQKCVNGACIGDSTCNASNCAGCCDQTVYPPVCLPGYDAMKCGINGQTCVSCGASGKCDMGACIVAPDCGPWNCAGCCNYSTWPPTCQPGFDPFACGYDGNACEMCSNGAVCEPTPSGGGVCSATQDCGPWNCTGCCDYNSWPPSCWEGSDPKFCGSGGNACTTCVAGQQCVASPSGDGGVSWSCSSVTQCGPGNCAGCCSGGVCFNGLDPASCGSGGALCQSCADSQKCTPSSSGGGTCTGTTVCGPATCSGCCDWNGVCRAGDTNATCGLGGEQCSNCLASDQICDPGAGNCVWVPNCGPLNCAGCCRVNGTCASGYLGSECGHGGVLCENCSSTGGVCQNATCYGGGTPSNCPAAYPGCSPSSANPAPITKLGACPAQALLNGQKACAGTPTPASCGTWFANLQNKNPECYACLLPFTGPKAFGTCLQPYLDPSCDHDLSCSLDCQTVACAQCSTDTQKQQCQEGVFNGVCSGYIQGVYCAYAAFSQAPFCESTGDSGTWIYNVGNHYCGSGTP